MRCPRSTASCGSCARSLVGCAWLAASAAANRRPRWRLVRLAPCKRSDAGPSPAPNPMAGCDWGRTARVRFYKTGTSSRQAAQSLPLGPACAPTSAASTSLCARLRPERSSAIHLPVGSILCSRRRAGSRRFCSISQRLHHSTFPPLLTLRGPLLVSPSLPCAAGRVSDSVLRSSCPTRRTLAGSLTLTALARPLAPLPSSTHTSISPAVVRLPLAPPRRASQLGPDGASSDGNPLRRPSIPFRRVLDIGRSLPWSNPQRRPPAQPGPTPAPSSER